MILNRSYGPEHANANYYHLVLTVTSDPTPASPASPLAPSGEDAAPRIVTSASLLAGRRELIIQHGADQYRLRLTASNKLILVK